MYNPNQSKIITKRQIQGEFGANGGVTIPNTNTTNPTGSSNSYYCMYVTLVQTTLSGTQTVDGESPSNGDKILVPYQTDASENGIYTYSSSGAWERIDGLSSGNQITILGGTKQGTIWVVETPTFEIGTDNISIIENAISRKDSSFSGFDAVTSLMTSDIGLFQVSDNSIMSATVQDILDLVPSELPTGTTDLALVSWDASTSAYVERAKVRVDSNGKLLLNRTTGTGPTLDINQTVNGTVIVVDNSGVNNYMELKSSGAAAYTFGKAAMLVYQDLYVQNQKTIFFKELATNGSNYVAIKAPASLAGDTTYILPSADGTADQVMKTDGSGNLGWADAGGGFYDGFAVCTADESVTGNTLTDSAYLTVSLDATSTYLIRAVLYLDTNGSAQQPKGNFAYTGTIDYSGLKNYNGTYKSSITDSNALYTPTTSKGYLNELTGMITTTTSGTFKLKFANTYGTGTVYLRKGSILYYKKVL